MTSSVPSTWLPEVPGPGDEAPTVVGRLRVLAGAMPDAEALVSRERTATFAEVAERVDAIAAELEVAVNAGGRQEPDTRPIAVLAEQSTTSLLAILGVLGTGRPVVVADPLLPVERLALVLERADAIALVADEERREAADAILAAGRSRPELLALDTVVAAPPAPPRPPSPGRRCVVFTSGSTGTPKAVTYDDGWLVNEAWGAALDLDLGPGDRTALVLPSAFAAGLTVLFMGLLNGATLCIADPRLSGVRELPDFLARTGTTTLHTTPSLLRSLLGVLPPEGGLEGLRLATTCGEAVHGRDVAALRRHLRADAVYTSWSGSSETGHLAFHRIDPADPVPDGVVPVGRPAANKLVRLLDEHGDDVPHGEIGEVTVTSAYLAEGYLGDPDTTAARFVPLPDGRVRYLMGDRGRRDADGTLHLLGRQDSALKIRGYLVEPAEVEAVLLTDPDVAEAVVVGHAVADGTEARLVAYVAPKSTEKALSTTALRRALRDRLPEWMVPSALVVLESLPRNERGKLDRAALPAPPPPTVGEPARSAWEAVVANIWSAVVGVDEVGRDSDFTEIGGDSLDVEQMLVMVSERLGVRLRTGDLADAPTLREFAARAAELGRDARSGRERGGVLRPVARRLHALVVPPAASPHVVLQRGRAEPRPIVLRSGAPDPALDALVAALGTDGTTLDDLRAADLTRRSRGRRTPPALARAVTSRHPGGPWVLVTGGDRPAAAAAVLLAHEGAVLLVRAVRAGTLAPVAPAGVRVVDVVVAGASDPVVDPASLDAARQALGTALPV
ncbi:non-ribosomal peptide synthetase [Actinomycetospora flava]|uniref:Non-ribosomal peptide synthetase n=1 Tax=Actinomycetospora flava TaxID=3129232 RepID=A0ABU8MB43_9PSEU